MCFSFVRVIGKILIVTIAILQISSRSDMGGGPKHMAMLMEELSKKKNINLFCASPTTPPFYKTFKDNCLKHFELPHRRFSFFIFLKLLVFCVHNEITIIHSHGFGAGIYSRLLGLFSFKTVHTFHGIHQNSSFSSKFKMSLETILKNLTSKGICVSKNEYLKAKDSLGYSPSQLEEIPNTIDFDLFKSKIKERTPDNIIKLGALCRLDRHKNVSFLISQLENLPENYELIIGGDGPEKANLESLVKNKGLEKRVKFLGEVSSPGSFFSTIDIYITASIGEGFPYTILEAVAALKPIVASNVYGHKEILPEKSLFNLDDPQDFKSKVLNADKQDTKKSFSNFLMRYGAETILGKIVSLYDCLL